MSPSSTYRVLADDTVSDLRYRIAYFEAEATVAQKRLTYVERMLAEARFALRELECQNATPRPMTRSFVVKDRTVIGDIVTVARQLYESFTPDDWTDTITVSFWVEPHYDSSRRSVHRNSRDYLPPEPKVESLRARPIIVSETDVGCDVYLASDGGLYYRFGHLGFQILYKGLFQRLITTSDDDFVVTAAQIDPFEVLKALRGTTLV